MPKAESFDRPTFLEELRATGNVSRAARAAGVSSRSYVYEVRNHDEEFARQWDDALEEGIDDLEQSAKEQALSGSAPTLMVLLLKAHRPSVYREPKGLADEERAALAQEMLAVFSQVAYAMLDSGQAQEVEDSVVKALKAGPKELTGG